jgi:hypothetical protein
MREMSYIADIFVCAAVQLCSCAAVQGWGSTGTVNALEPRACPPTTFCLAGSRGQYANYLFHLCDWRILERWALESPAQLRALESEGDVALLGHLFEQQQMEHSMLTSESALEHRRSGKAEHEILVLNEIPTHLA